MAADDVPLKDYIDAKIGALKGGMDSLQVLMQQHFDLNDRALKLANEAMLARLESMNEFRAQIKEERSSLATKENLCTLEEKMDLRIKPLETLRAVTAGQLKLLTILPSAIATIIAIIAFFKG